jgi:hypothetical protein
MYEDLVRKVDRFGFYLGDLEIGQSFSSIT